MEEFAKYIDVLIQAPLAVIMMWLIYKTFKMFESLFDKLIDKLNK